MSVHFTMKDAARLTKAVCALSQAELTLSSGVDVRMVAAVGITLPLGTSALRQAFVLVPTAVGKYGAELDEGMAWRRCPALDIRTDGFESLDLTKLVARRLAYVADDGAELVFAAVRKAA